MITNIITKESIVKICNSVKIELSKKVTAVAEKTKAEITKWMSHD